MNFTLISMELYIHKLFFALQIHLLGCIAQHLEYLDPNTDFLFLESNISMQFLIL